MAQPLELTCPAKPSDTGAYRLQWRGPEDATFRLQQRADAEGEQGVIVYQGVDRASTITGQREGHYQYRVGLVEQGAVKIWSPPCTVEVAPPSIALALVLFFVGALITGSAIVAILRGHRAHRRGELG